MKRISIFVEGQTERIFVEYFLKEYLGYANVCTQSYKQLGDGIIAIGASGSNDTAQFYFLIFDVGGDEKAVSSLLEKAEGMVTKGSFSFIFALRDLYPALPTDKNKIIEETKKEFSKFPFADKLDLVLAIREVEAWFLADYNVFSKIDTKLSVEYIKNQIQLDLVNDDPENYSHPASAINRILELIGERYKKTKADAYRIVSRLNFGFLYLGTEGKIKSFSHFIWCINKSIA